MRIKSLDLEDYCGFKKGHCDFGDFTCFIGPNGIGKTTILNAVSLLCSDLNFGDDIPQEGGKWRPSASAQARLRAFLRKNIRNYGQLGRSTFTVSGVFEEAGKEYNVVVNQEGFKENELRQWPKWWPGICYFAKFDSDMVNFQLREELWPKFACAYEEITGFSVEPEIYSIGELGLVGDEQKDADINPDEKVLAERIVVGFYLNKPQGRIHSRFASAGEKKISKALTQVVNLEPERMPHIVLVDNLEMHVHYKRHLRMFDAIQNLFKGFEVQIISTTHSTVIMEHYEAKHQLIDVEQMIQEVQPNVKV